MQFHKSSFSPTYAPKIKNYASQFSHKVTNLTKTSDSLLSDRRLTCFKAGLLILIQVTLYRLHLALMEVHLRKKVNLHFLPVVGTHLSGKSTDLIHYFNEK